jgi:DNA topoisomerase-1
MRRELIRARPPLCVILVIAEKPNAAKKIADALGSFRTQKGGESYYYELEGGSVVVAPAVGHVFGLEPARDGYDYPIFETKWIPKYETKGFEYTRSYIDNLTKLGKQADEIIIATDYDVEGSVIGYNILNLAIGKDDLDKVKRMKFSTLTPNELRRAFKDAHAHNKFEKGMVEAGLMRHYLDWFWGINLSRALTQAFKTTGNFKVLSTGRVQGPALKVLAEREREIRGFDSKFYYKLLARVKGFDAGGPETEDIDRALDIFLKLKPPAKVAGVDKRRSRMKPPPPFNLTDLQTEASSILKYTPDKTLKIAQKLYEDGLISYPRTSSQELPEELDTDALLRKLAKDYPFATKLVGRKYHKGKKKDPAHPAIYPTGESAKGLEGPRQRVYDLIARRFMASFSDPAVREGTTITLDVSGVEFVLNGLKTVVKGFTAIYPKRLKEEDVPEMKKGEELPVEHFDLSREQDRPPRRYTAAGLLKEMEKLNIGTKATRANIIETLYARKYIEEKSIRVTDFGLSVVDSLEDAAPEIVSVDLTRNFEEKMEKVYEGDRGMDHFLDNAKEKLKGMLASFRASEEKLGEKLLKGAGGEKKARRDSKPPKEVFKGGKKAGECSCGGTVYALRSSRDKRYARCSKCNKTWGLPQRGRMTILKETCRQCKLRKIYIKRKDAEFSLCMEHGFDS